MKNIFLHGDVRMEFLEVPHDAEHHTFYLSSCESAADIDAHDSNISSRCSSLSSISSLNIGRPTPLSPVQTNMFLNVLKRLHRLTLRRKKHGQYRSLSTSLHLFFKKHPQSSIDISQSTIEFCKSSSSPQFPTNNTDNENKFLRTKLGSHSSQQIYRTGANNDKHFNSKTHNFHSRRSLLIRLRHSDKTVSEDNNTNTLSSVDLALTPQILPTVLITESTSLVTPVQQLTSFDYNRVSHHFVLNLFFCFVRSDPDSLRLLGIN